jgi:pyruvate dehydrogenase complex dehydrogenase (E1) component
MSLKHMNKIASVPKVSVPSLGGAQAFLEESTKEYLSAQAAYVKALERLTAAEEVHGRAMLALVNEMNTIKTKCQVPPVALR